MYDLRSDTITLPTKHMRLAMANAEVGDDVYHEDASINRLERMASEMVGKEDAIFVPSGSMGNLIALYINGGRGKKFFVTVIPILSNMKLVQLLVSLVR